jgi:hypothetical protein
MSSEKKVLKNGAEKILLYKRWTDYSTASVEWESEGDTNNRRRDWTPLVNSAAQKMGTEGTSHSLRNTFTWHYT